MMANKNLTAWVVGGAVVAAGAYFIIKGMGGAKMQATVQYDDIADEAAARLVKGGINPSQFVFGYVDPETITKPLIVVGAQMTNAVYAFLQSNGVFPAITQDDQGKGFIFVRNWRGQDVYGVAGWLAPDTLKAAQWIKDNKELPTHDLVL